MNDGRDGNVAVPPIIVIAGHCLNAVINIERANLQACLLVSMRTAISTNRDVYKLLC